MEPIYILCVLSSKGASFEYLTVTDDVDRARAWYEEDKDNHQVRCFEAMPEWRDDGDMSPAYGDGERRPAFGGAKGERAATRRELVAEIAGLEARLAEALDRLD